MEQRLGGPRGLLWPAGARAKVPFESPALRLLFASGAVSSVWVMTDCRQPVSVSRALETDERIIGGGGKRRGTRRNFRRRFHFSAAILGPHDVMEELTGIASFVQRGLARAGGLVRGWRGNFLRQQNRQQSVALDHR